MSVLDTIERVMAQVAKPPSRSAERARLEMLAALELRTIARVRAERCVACQLHLRRGVPCLQHTPTSLRAARAKAIGVTR